MVLDMECTRCFCTSGRGGFWLEAVTGGWKGRLGLYGGNFVQSGIHSSGMERTIHSLIHSTYKPCVYQVPTPC